MPAPPDLSGVEHRFVQAGGLRMHVAVAGDPARPPVLLLHGWPQHWWMWRGVIPELAGRFRILAPDLRGLGWSDAPQSGYLKEEMAQDLAALLDELEVERADVVGHDWGGYVGFLLALLHPARVRRYLALNIIHPWPERSPSALPGAIARLAYQLPLITPFVNRRIVQREDFIPRFLKATAVHRDAWTEDDFEIYRAPLRHAQRIHASAEIYRTFVTRELIQLAIGRYRRHRLHAPTLLLFGVHDEVMKPEQLRGHEAYADDMRVELVADAGHFIAEEKPELVAGRALEHFAD